MDLYAYAQIEDLEKYLKDNNIEVPRLRGLRLMKEEKLIEPQQINDTEYALFNEYVGKNVLYVHARIGGGNRDYYAEDWEKIRKHPLYLADCDDCFDTTYCDIYYDLDKAVAKNEK